MDIAVLTSHPRVGTLPLALIEGKNAGLPVVSTRVGALAELVDDRTTGLLVPSGEEEDLAGAIAGLIRDPARRVGMGLRGQRRAAAVLSV
jgi:glycosyltransferase involved in cell wall biosynthesis